MRERICDQHSTIVTENGQGKRKTLIVVFLTALTMFLEIFFGLITGSLALLTDGVHMGTHTFALMVTLIAYVVADKNRRNPNFAFSSGKISVLGGYTNAILLGLTALLMVKEAAERLLNPQEIDFTEAIIVALFGLIINVISAFILGSSHGEDADHTHEDHNLKAAYVHVLTDALTSILAIVALSMGKLFDLTWPDAIVAIIGAAVILKWAYSLLKSTGEILVDYYPQKDDTDKIADAVNRHGGTLLDLHLWKISESHMAALIAIADANPIIATELKEELRSILELDHITIEVRR